jgi:hypothetical protein
MSTLFDLGADESRKKKKRARPAPASVAVEAEAGLRPPGAAGDVAPIIGRLDDIACADESCGGEAHDVIERGWAEIDESGKKKKAWKIECCFCGTGQWVAAREERPAEEEKKPSGEFVFAAGRYPGMTVSEAASQPGAIEYLKWVSEHHKEQAVRESVRTWLDLNRPDA